jgi:molecular chaperone DnaJ
MTRGEAFLLLDVPPDNRDPDVVKAAFRKMVKTHHTDSGTHAADTSSDKMGRISTAYRILSGREPEGAPEGIMDIAVCKGADARAEVTITLKQALTGTTVPAPAELGGTCITCHGSGKTRLRKPIPCIACSGEGYIVISRGVLRIRSQCSVCDGKGQVTQGTCIACHGSGIGPGGGGASVPIPPGAADGHIVTLAGRGYVGVNGGPRGDLHVSVRVQPHPVFKRRGAGLEATLKISFTEACLGTSTGIPTLEGKILMVKLPPGTAAGRLFTFPGYGMVPEGGGPRGSLTVKTDIRVPAVLSKEQTELLLKWKQLEKGR